MSDLTQLHQLTHRCFKCVGIFSQDLFHRRFLSLVLVSDCFDTRGFFRSHLRCSLDALDHDFFLLAGSGASYAVIGTTVRGSSSTCSQTTAMYRPDEVQPNVIDRSIAGLASCRSICRVSQNIFHFIFGYAMFGDMGDVTFRVIVQIPNNDGINHRHPALVIKYIDLH